NLARLTRPLALLTAVAVIFGAGACNEQLDSTASCPLLCPSQPTQVKDTTLFGVELDTSIAGYPPQGTEAVLFVTTAGDTLDTRGIIRFDSLSKTFRHVGSTEDSAVFVVDTGAFVTMRLVLGATLGAPVRVDVHDVEVF